MKKSMTLLSAVTAGALALTLAACGSTGGGTADPTNVNPEGEIEGRAISWLNARPADGPTLKIVEEIADEFAEKYPGFELNLINTPDRPSYLQKVETLAAANKLPEFFDTDATPFAQKLVDKGQLMDVEALLKDMGQYDRFREGALNYQRFEDGALYQIPLEFQTEMFWYNKGIFEDAGIEVPTTLDEFPDMCRSLRDAGVTPFALDGQDQWPLERFIAYIPFRLAGPDYLNEVKVGQRQLSDDIGRTTVEWLADLADAQCFDPGFTSTGYADAQGMFTSGKAAVYGIGTWELASLATDALSPEMQENIDFFTLPGMEGAVTADNEYVAPSGIGMAVNAQTFDPLVRAFLEYLLEEYPARYAALGEISPTTDAETTMPDNAIPMYEKALATADEVGPTAAMPWDTKLDPNSNTRLQQELTLLIQGNISADEFIDTMDSTIADNVPKYFGEQSN